MFSAEYSFAGQRHGCSGAVLIIGLIIVAAMAMVAVIGMNGPISQEVLAKNSYDKFKMRGIAESLNNYTLAKTGWINQALGLVVSGEGLNFTVNDVNVAGADVARDYDMTVDIIVKPIPLDGAQAGEGATGQVVMLTVRSAVASKANPEEVSILTRGYLRLVAKLK